MAPSKVITDHQQKLQQQKMVASVMSKITGRITTRSQTNSKMAFDPKFNAKDLPKRKADQLSPPKGKTTKRSALLDLNVNATTKANETEKGKPKKAPVLQKQKETVKVSATTQHKVQTLVNVKIPTSHTATNVTSVSEHSNKAGEFCCK